jgi:hypothetical protein
MGTLHFDIENQDLLNPHNTNINKEIDIESYYFDYCDHCNLARKHFLMCCGNISNSILPCRKELCVAGGIDFAESRKHYEYAKLNAWKKRRLHLLDIRAQLR